jgi:hypothetical protein
MSQTLPNCGLQRILNIDYIRTEAVEVSNHGLDYWKTPFVARAALIVVMITVTVPMLVLTTLAQRSHIWYSLGVGIRVGAGSWLIRAERFHR